VAEHSDRETCEGIEDYFPGICSLCGCFFPYLSVPVLAWRSLNLMAEGFIYRRLTYIKVAKVDGLFSPSYTRRLLPPSVLTSFQQQAMLLPIMEGKKKISKDKKMLLQDSKALRSGHLIAVINGCLHARRERHLPFEAGGSDLGRLGRDG